MKGLQLVIHFLRRPRNCLECYRFTTARLIRLDKATPHIARCENKLYKKESLLKNYRNAKKRKRLLTLLKSPKLRVMQLLAVKSL